MQYEQNDDQQVEQIEPTQNDSLPAASDSDVQAAFENSFNKTSSHDKAEPEPEPEQEKPVNEFDGFTPAEIRQAIDASRNYESMRKSQDKTSGALGALRQQFENERLHKPKPVELDANTFARLGEDFPELAEALAADLKGKLFAQPSLDQNKLNEMIHERMESMRNEGLEKERASVPKFLSLMHKDHAKIAADPEFSRFLQSLPEDEKAKAASSWDPFEIGEYMTKFKDDRENRSRVQAQKQNKLQRAITPQGGGTSQNTKVMTAEQAMVAAYNKTLRK